VRLQHSMRVKRGLAAVAEWQTETGVVSSIDEIAEVDSLLDEAGAVDVTVTVSPGIRRRKRSLGRPFSLVWFSVIVSSTGDGMFVTAFPLLAATLTRDPVLIAGVTISSRLPWLFFSMITGALADRMDRRRLMISADLVRFVLVAAFGIAIAVGAEELWMLYSCAFLLGAAETLHVNAAQAIIPALIEREQLLDANARFGSAQTVAAQFVGPPLGSSLFNLSGSIPFLADAASFAGSAALVAALPDVHRVASGTFLGNVGCQPGALQHPDGPALGRPPNWVPAHRIVARPNTQI
jgi:MFS family permease